MGCWDNGKLFSDGGWQCTNGYLLVFDIENYAHVSPKQGKNIVLEFLNTQI